MTKSDEAPIEGQTFVANFDVEIAKTDTEGDQGKVTAIVSVYNVAYRMGFMSKHMIEFGAFAASLAGQATIPLFWQHNWNWSEQPPIGTGVASESQRGLTVDGSLFLDIEAGRAVFNAMKAGALRQWSIGYRITKFEVEETDDGFDIIHVKEAELLEASSVLKGANPETDTLKVANEANVMAMMVETNERLADLAETVASLAYRVAKADERLDEQVDTITALDDALHDIEVDLAKSDDPPEGAPCAYEDCGALATTLITITDETAEWVCDQHACPPQVTASSGEEVQVEPIAAGGSEAPDAEAASASEPRVPDFLPPLPDGTEPTEASERDVMSITRVMQCWRKVNS